MNDAEASDHRATRCWWQPLESVASPHDSSSCNLNQIQGTDHVSSSVTAKLGRLNLVV